jgi:prolipoprotein diacylglyceryltransferase
MGQLLSLPMLAIGLWFIWRARGGGRGGGRAQAA